MTKMLYILAGPNGAGKTTAARYLLPEQWQCLEFVNADEIARGLSPFNAEAQAMQAGRLMLDRIDKLINSQQTLAFETTLATKGFIRVIEKAHRLGFRTHLTFLALTSAQLAQQRVAKRVREGGHAIAPDVIERRFHRGLHHFFQLYQPCVQHWEFYDNSHALPELLANSHQIADAAKFEMFRALEQ